MSPFLEVFIDKRGLFTGLSMAFLKQKKEKNQMICTWMLAPSLTDIMRFEKLLWLHCCCIFKARQFLYKKLEIYIYIYMYVYKLNSKFYAIRYYHLAEDCHKTWKFKYQNVFASYLSNYFSLFLYIYGNRALFYEENSFCKERNIINWWREGSSWNIFILKKCY